jgi:fimbrial chaperone protein
VSFSGRIRAFFIATLLLGSVAFIEAFTFDPMSVVFDPTGPGSVRSFRLRNTSEERIAVRVQILTRESVEDGSERNDPVKDGLFVVFPSRFVMEGNTTRILKVQWKGGDLSGREQPYRIVAEQVPVAFEEKRSSGISLLFRFMGAMYVRPKDAVPAAVQVVSAVGADSSGTRGIRINVRNSGGVHALMLDVKFAVTASGGESIDLPESAFAGVEGENVLANTDRIFFIPYERAEIGAAYNARISFTPEN